MPAQKRFKTEYPGVTYIEGTSIDGKRKEKIYMIRFRKGSKQVEEKAGRQYLDQMTAAKASRIRALKMEGRTDSNTEKRAKEKAEKEAIENRWTFQKLLEEYLLSKPELKGAANDQRRFRSYLEKEFADKTPEEVTHFDIKKLKQKLTKKKLKPATIRHALEVLRRLSNFGAKRDLCSGLKFVIEMPQVNNQKIEDLTSEQLSRLLEVLDEEKNVQIANLFRMALYTGMRRGELFDLKWEHINFSKKMITIVDPKGGTDQIIPLNTIAEQIMLDHPKTGSEYVFPGKNGNRRDNCNRPMKRIKQMAGLPEGFRMFHGLRHVYASMLASSGKVDLYTLQKLLTHKSPIMTQRYAHLRDKTLIQASNVISDLIQPQDNVLDLDQHRGKNAS